VSHTSLSLLERASRQADSESWNRLFELYSPLLRRWLARYQVQDSDAEDLVQDVLSVVVRELPAFQHNRQAGAFRSWLRTILVNRLRAFWRARDYRPQATGHTDLQRRLEGLADQTSQISRLWERQHDEHVMRRLLDLVQPKFAPTTWAAFWRQMVDGVATRDVARELGMSIDSVYAAKSRVLRMLRQEVRGLID
jgi:RNA polymerase sigma factor (sigma-70 family)